MLIGRAEQVDAVRGMSMTSSCMECCPDSWYSFWMSPSSAYGFPGDTTQFSTIQQNQTCYGDILEPFTVGHPTWSSTDPSVASCDQTGLATGQLPGFTHIQSRWTVRFWDSDFDGQCHRYLEQALVDALCDIRPKIDSISPAFGIPGTTVQVSIDGRGFDASSTVEVGGTGVTVSGAILRSSTQITANFTIDVNAAGGDISVAVMSNNATSNSVPFDIRVPHHLRVVSDNIGFPTCPDGSPTAVREIQYEVLDVHRNVISSDITVMESFANLTTNTCNSSQPSPQTCTQVGPNSIPFVDQLTVGCNTTIGSVCGFDVDNKWQWCPSGRTPVTLASFHFLERNNQILVNGVAQFTPGTEIFP